MYISKTLVLIRLVVCEKKGVLRRDRWRTRCNCDICVTGGCHIHTPKISGLTLVIQLQSDQYVIHSILSHICQERNVGSSTEHCRKIIQHHQIGGSSSIGVKNLKSVGNSCRAFGHISLYDWRIVASATPSMRPISGRVDHKIRPLKVQYTTI